MMIKIENLSKRFGEKIAVKNLSLEIKKGEIFAFLGPNGAGKTTTIKSLVGLLQPTSGKLTVCGYDMVSQTIEAKKCLAYVPDQPYLYDKLTGREFIKFVGAMHGIDEKEMNREVERLIDLFELKDYVDELTENYSHGMKQRVVFSSALIHKPQVLIVDEPMVGLDPRSAVIVKNIFQEQAKTGAVFMSTHSLDVAEQTATRIGIFNRGELIVLGTLAELREKLQREARLEEIFLELTAEEEEKEEEEVAVE